MGVIFKDGVMYGGNNLVGLADSTLVAIEYDALSTYDVNDYVIYNGGLYRCTTAISTAEAWNSSHWTREVLTNQITAWLNIPLVNNVGY